MVDMEEFDRRIAAVKEIFEKSPVKDVDSFMNAVREVIGEALDETERLLDDIDNKIKDGR